MSKTALLREFEIARNLGNYLITEGASLALGGCLVKYVPFWHIDGLVRRQELQDTVEAYDVCVFVTANILHVDFSLESELRFFQRWDKPLVFMSVGVQKIEDLRSTLPGHTAAFLEILARENVTVFTRGPLTKAFLDAQNITKAIEACCPSAYAYPDAFLKGLRRIKEAALDEPGEIWVNGYVGAGPASNQEVTNLMSLSGRAKYVYQDEPLLFGVLDEDGDGDRVFDDYRNATVGAPKAVADGLGAAREFLAFFSPEVWRARASQIDWSIGRRFHGNLIALQAGRPAFFAVHDDRVSDMTTALGVPTLAAAQMSDAAECRSALAQLSRDFDLAKAEDLYMASHERFRDGLKAAGLA